MFILIFGIYSYFYQAGGWNQNTRFNLVRSVVEQGTLNINPYHTNTLDKAKIGDSYYCDKAPGLSFLAVPMYMLIYLPVSSQIPTIEYLDMASYLVILFSVSIPSAFAAILLYTLLGFWRISEINRFLFTIAYAFGTLSFPYSTMFFGHQLASSLLIIGFIMLIFLRAKMITPKSVYFFATGIVLGYSIITEYPGLVAVGVLMGYCLYSVRPISKTVWLVAGVVIPISGLLVYNTILFGGPFVSSYTFMIHDHSQSGLFTRWGLPQFQVLSAILFSPGRGMFYSAPWLLFSIPGAAIYLRKKRFTAEITVSILISVIFIWIHSAMIHWMGGRGIGPRYSISAIPFLAVLASGVFATGIHIRQRILRILVKAGIIIPVLISIFLMLVSTAVIPQVPGQIENPFRQLLIPAFLDGQLALNTQSIDHPRFIPDGRPAAWNLGQLAGCDGLSSLIPLFVFVVIMLGWYIAVLRDQKKQP